ncbi:MAG: hypothetical protein ACRC62_06295 [Microcoleus sp.]
MFNSTGYKFKSTECFAGCSHWDVRSPSAATKANLLILPDYRIVSEAPPSDRPYAIKKQHKSLNPP